MAAKRRLEKVRDIRLRSSEDLVEMVDGMYAGGGFTAKSVAECARILYDMVSDKQCRKFLSFPAAPVATGVRGVLVEMVKRGMVDVIITASGTLDHDLARTWADYYHGSFSLDDVKLRRLGYHRLGNILVPLNNYGPLLERRLQPWLEGLYSGGRRRMSSEEFCAELGSMVGSEDSLLYWCSKRGVPVFVPGVMDGAVGCQIWMFANRHSDFTIDVIRDEKRLADIVYESKRSGALVIGGGISKHHLLWWNQFKGGLDYACYITTAVEYDGSLSGAQVREAISWGKVKERARTVNLYADATSVLPLVVSYALTRMSGGSKRSGRR